MERILSLEDQLRKFFFEKRLDSLTSVPQWRTQEIILASCARGNSGKMTDYAGVLFLILCCFFRVMFSRFKAFWIADRAKPNSLAISF